MPTKTKKRKTKEKLYVIIFHNADAGISTGDYSFNSAKEAKDHVKGLATAFYTILGIET